MEHCVEQLRAPRVAAVCCGLLALVVSAVPAGGQEVPFPLPEDYLPSQDLSGYLKRATDFLDRSPSSRFAPRVALEALMAATQSSFSEVAETMKGRLLFEYPTSMQTAFMVSMFKDADGFRQYAVRCADMRLRKTPGALPGQFAQVVALGLRQYGNTVLDDPEFLIRAHCFAKTSGTEKAVEVTEAALKKMSQTNTNLEQLVRIHLDNGCDPVMKIMRFHERKRDARAAFFVQYYLTRLLPSEEKRPEIVKIRAEAAIRSREYEEVLALTGAPSGDALDDPQMLFWKAWACFALEKDEQAAGCLRQIAERHAGTEVAAAAELYAEGIATSARCNRPMRTGFWPWCMCLRAAYRFLRRTSGMWQSAKM